MNDIAIYRDHKVKDPIRAVVVLFCEEDCNAMEGEYSIHLTSMNQGLYLGTVGESDDPYLIRECITEKFDFTNLPSWSLVEVNVVESGEWEDVFWNKYFVIESWKRIPLPGDEDYRDPNTIDMFSEASQ